MKLIVELNDDEAYRKIEDEEENIREAYKFLIRAIENEAAKYQIRYLGIDVEG